MAPPSSCMRPSSAALQVLGTFLVHTRRSKSHSDKALITRPQLPQRPGTPPVRKQGSGCPSIEAKDCSSDGEHINGRDAALQLCSSLPPPLPLPVCSAPQLHSVLSHERAQAAPQGADVRMEDQQKINTFSRLNTRLHELEAQLAAKKVRAAHDLDVNTSAASGALLRIPS